MFMKEKAKYNIQKPKKKEQMFVNIIKIKKKIKLYKIIKQIRIENVFFQNELLLSLLNTLNFSIVFIS